MKTISKAIATLVCMITGGIQLLAQDIVYDSSRLELARIEPYRLLVTYDKTTHLIFPAKIRYVDLGSGYLIADKAPDAENVLRVKSAVPSFDTETNFSVVTNEGQFYNFNVQYSDLPPALNYDMEKMQHSLQKNVSDAVLLAELGNNRPILATQLLELIYNDNKRSIRHIGARSYGIQALLKSIYIANGNYYFHVELRNRTNVPFEIDFISFKIQDKKVAKRTVIQEQSLKPLRMFRPLETIRGTAMGRNVFMLERFTIANDKILLIEIFEKNGGRHQVLEVEYSDLIHALPVTELHFKFK